MTEVTGSQVEVKLENLPKEKYKIELFHDANDNWKLDTEDGTPI